MKTPRMCRSVENLCRTQRDIGPTASVADVSGIPSPHPLRMGEDIGGTPMNPNENRQNSKDAWLQLT